MNKARRSKIGKIQEQISDMLSDLNEIRDEEESSYYNLPESIQSSDRGEAMSEAVDNLDEAISMLEDVDSYLNDAKGE